MRPTISLVGKSVGLGGQGLQAMLGNEPVEGSINQTDCGVWA